MKDSVFKEMIQRIRIVCMCVLAEADKINLFIQQTPVSIIRDVWCNHSKNEMHIVLCYDYSYFLRLFWWGVYSFFNTNKPGLQLGLSVFLLDRMNTIKMSISNTNMAAVWPMYEWHKHHTIQSPKTVCVNRQACS